MKWENSWQCSRRARLRAASNSKTRLADRTCALTRMRRTEGYAHIWNTTGFAGGWLFSLLSFAARKLVHILLEWDLAACQIFLQLVLDILFYHLYILSCRIRKSSPAPEVPAPLFVLQIRISSEDHQAAFAFEHPYKLCYTHVRFGYSPEEECDLDMPLPQWFTLSSPCTAFWWFW